MVNLTPSKELYIKTIYILSDDNQGVHITEIAEKLEISKASVCTAMKSLQEGNYEPESKTLFVRFMGFKNLRVRILGFLKTACVYSLGYRLLINN